MSDSRSVNRSDRLVHWIATISVVILTQSIFGFAHSSWAESALTNGKSEGSVSGSSDTSVNVSVGTFSNSRADSFGDHQSEAHTVTDSWESADIPSRKVHIKTGAEAEAFANESKLVAKANAWANGTAGNVSKATSTGAIATSTSDERTASVWSSDGSYADAKSGLRKAVSAYTPGGLSSIFDQDRFKVALSYQTDGHFSIAVAGLTDAKAYLGQTSNSMALDNRDVNSIMRSVMSASALAGPDSASAFVRSALEMTFKDARSEATARGMSEASASVFRNGTKLTVTVRASENGGCASARGSNRSSRHECMVVTRVFHLKKAGHYKVVARAGSHGRKSRHR